MRVLRRILEVHASTLQDSTRKRTKCNIGVNNSSPTTVCSECQTRVAVSRAPSRNEQDIEDLRASISFLEEAIQAYDANAWELLIPRLHSDHVELADPVDPAAVRARGRPDRDAVDDQRLDLANRMDAKKRLFEGRLLWSYRDYGLLLEQTLAVEDDNLLARA